MRVRGIGIGIAAMAVAALGLTGCSEKKATTVADKDKLVVGVKYDQPGLGLKTTGGVEGFDVDVAKYVAKKLGVADKDVTFKEARSANRESFLQNGTVDMVVATYSITEARKPKVTFAGPYIVTHQDLMVRANDNSVKDLASVKGKRICQVSGSSSWKNIVEGSNKLNQKVAAKLVPASAYEECITKLKGDSLDVVTTDGTILAGFAQRESGAFKIVNVPFTDEKYGIGLKKGDTKGCEAVNKAVADMYKDGTAKQLWDKWFGKTALPFDSAQPPAEGCS